MNPRCFGYIMENREYLKKENRLPIKDCKECDLQTNCIEYYDWRVYQGEEDK